MKKALETFKKNTAMLRAYSHAMGVMYYDSETVMPAGNAQTLGETFAALSEESYKYQTSDEYKEAVGLLYGRREELDMITRREVEEAYEGIKNTECIPMEEYVEYEKTVSASNNAWRAAKRENNYSLFEPYLNSLVTMSRRFAGYRHPELAPYDCLLNEYEKGMNMQVLDKFFDELRQVISPLVKEIADSKTIIDDGFLNQTFPIDKQKELSSYLMNIMGIDKTRCTLGETEHPFTTGFTKYDIRITTHYYEDLLLSNMYSVIHEGGHALYELGIGDDIARSPLGSGASMGIHESQSRFYENIIGRSAEFIGVIFPMVKKLFPKQLKGVSAYDFYLAANKSTPSLIRTEADELTYSLHIMVRYELEKLLMTGELSTKDLPCAWNEMYKKYLGIDVPTDREGVLQDSHWAGGSFGYFPSYAIGSAYSAQILSAMQRDIDVFSEVASGDISKITAWLEDKIFRFGALKKPAEIIMNACGEPFDPDYYVQYLTNKFKGIYRID